MIINCREKNSVPMSYKLLCTMQLGQWLVPSSCCHFSFTRSCKLSPLSSRRLAFTLHRFLSFVRVPEKLIKRESFTAAMCSVWFCSRTPVSPTPTLLCYIVYAYIHSYSFSLDRHIKWRDPVALGQSNNGNHSTDTWQLWE